MSGTNNLKSQHKVSASASPNTEILAQRHQPIRNDAFSCARWKTANTSSTTIGSSTTKTATTAGPLAASTVAPAAPSSMPDKAFTKSLTRYPRRGCPLIYVWHLRLLQDDLLTSATAFPNNDKAVKQAWQREPRVN